ncbi:MAG: cysteine-rich small domain-containing protein [Acidobacteriota bacterium]
MSKQPACQASHAFFSNKDCAYFPCHKGVDPECFNCLFCFCPLYFLEDCGGDWRMAKGVKDCSGCTKPHEPGGYERTIARLKEEFARRRAQAQQDEEVS